MVTYVGKARKCCLLIKIILLLHGLIGKIVTSHEIGKHGICPKPQGIVGHCIDNCSNDNDCVGDNKCCSNGCGHTCQKPLPDCSLVKCRLSVCPEGYRLEHGPCCPYCVPEICPNGRKGLCGTLVGLTCPTGSTCKYDGNYSDAAGVCCIDNPKPIKVCTAPIRMGQCRVPVTQYFYNTSTCKCEKFNRGGCLTSVNNFFDIAYCKASCEKPMKSNPVCELAQTHHGGCKTNWNLNRWFFNRTSCKCEPFKWNGCGSANNFLNKEWCESNCGCYDCNQETNICNLPFNPTSAVTCSAYFPSYGYNTKSCRCEKFIYGGCGGNANRFRSLSECEKHCGNNECSVRVYCDQPASPGTFHDKITRYFYNTKTCKCEKFIWGGSGGNSNNFKTHEDCMKSCHGFNTCDEPAPEINCLLPKESGLCTALLKRFYYDHLNCQCKTFTYGGCGGNTNNFKSMALCQGSCRNTKCPVCNQRADPGNCRGHFKRFFFNIKSCKCEEFIYGGCGGNENRYDTKEKCENICGRILCPVCNLPAEKGHCKAKLDRWYFDAAECKCKLFQYGGCGGNMNRFLTEEDCKSSCGNFSCPVCTEPRQSESCVTANKRRRFYYNPLKNKCEPFMWGGCQPNGNNFIQMKSCMKVCKNFVCSLQVKVGPCEAAIERYYFNTSTGKCQEFLWGGCDPNGNNFKSLKKCSKICKRR